MKGQLALEFVMMVAFAIFVGMVFIAAGSRILADAGDVQRSVAIDQVAYMVQDELILATLVQDGYDRTFYVPTRADRFAYTINNTRTTLTLSSGSIQANYQIPNVTGNVAKGDVRVRRLSGEVIVG